MAEVILKKLHLIYSPNALFPFELIHMDFLRSNFASNYAVPKLHARRTAGKHRIKSRVL